MSVHCKPTRLTKPNPCFGWWPPAISLLCIKLLREKEKLKKDKRKDWRESTECDNASPDNMLQSTCYTKPWEDTVSKSGYIKILKTAWEGKNKNNDIKRCLQNPPSCIMQKIYFYIHIRTYTYIPFIIAQISRKICIDS